MLGDNRAARCSQSLRPRATGLRACPFTPSGKQNPWPLLQHQQPQAGNSKQTAVTPSTAPPAVRSRPGCCQTLLVCLEPPDPSMLHVIWSSCSNTTPHNCGRVSVPAGHGSLPACTAESFRLVVFAVCVFSNRTVTVAAALTVVAAASAATEAAREGPVVSKWAPAYQEAAAAVCKPAKDTPPSSGKCSCTSINTKLGCPCSPCPSSTPS